MQEINLINENKFFLGEVERLGVDGLGDENEAIDRKFGERGLEEVGVK